MSEVAFVCRPELEAAFGLAGLTTHVARDAVEARNILSRLAHNGVPLVAIQDQLYAEIGDGDPVAVDVVPFPGPRFKETLSSEEYIAEILRRAIGYRVRT